MMSPEEFAIQRIRENGPDRTDLTTREWNITDDLIVNLAVALRTNTHLTHITIINSVHPGSHFTERGAQALCDALSVNRTLVSLRFMAGVVGNANAAGILGSMLRNNRSITFFQMSDTPIDEAAMTEIATALEDRNRTLTYLELRNCQINPVSCARLAQALTRNHRVQQLDLSSNPVGDQGVSALSASLRHNLGLRKLMLQRANLSDQAGAQIFEGAKHSKFMRMINLDSNQLGPESSTKLAELLEVNPLIESLSVHENPNLNSNQILQAMSRNNSLMEFESGLNQPVRQIQQITHLNRTANLAVCRLMLLGSYDPECTYRGAVNRDALFFVLQAFSYRYMSQENFNSLSGSIAGVMQRRAERAANPDLLQAAPVAVPQQQEAARLIEVPVERQQPAPEVGYAKTRPNLKSREKTHELPLRSIKEWFDPTGSSVPISLEGLWRIFAGRQDRAWKRHPVGPKKNHIGLSDIPSLGILYMLEAFFRGHWIKNPVHARRFATVFAPIWLPLQGLRIVVSAALVLTLAAVVLTLAPFVLLWRGVVKLLDKIDRAKWTRTLKKNDQGELDFSVLDQAEQKIKNIKPENKIWIVQEDKKGQYQATLKDQTMTNIDSCTKIIKKTSEAQPKTEKRTIYEWAKDNNPRHVPSFGIKSRDHYAVLWRRQTESAARDQVGKVLPVEDAHPDLFCYQSRA